MEHGRVTRGFSDAIQFRTLPAELRVERAAEERPRIVGHAAVFNQLSEEMWGFREQIAPGAFRKTIQEADIRGLFNHDENFVLGRNRAGTLKLREDETGLAIDNEPPDTTWANDLMVSMERGDLNQMSFAFFPVQRRIDINEADDTVTVTLLEVRLRDVSVVTYPAYPQTDASVRSIVGLDFPALMRSIVKAENGLPLKGADRSLMREAMERLTRSLAEEEPPPPPVTPPLASEPELATGVETLRRRLGLARRLAA